jgi:hypothetical protein
MDTVGKTIEQEKKEKRKCKDKNSEWAKDR